MKQDCGQNQFTRGEGGLNVTAGTAIHYLQEAGGKITRWHSGDDSRTHSGGWSSRFSGC